MSWKPLILIAFALAALAGCGSFGASSGPASSGSSAAVQAAPSPDCRAEVVSWRDGGGSAQLGAFTSDLSAVQKADYALAAAAAGNGDLTAAESDLQSAAASLQSDAQAAEANPPPACVPHLRPDYRAALTDYSKVAADSQNAVSELGSSSYDVAAADVKAATAAANAGNRKLAAATADITAFSKT
jgi:hypothetical protein